MSETIDPCIATDARQRLIHAAAEAFMKEGYRVSVDRIAAAAGVAKQTLYNHFSSKEDLFSEVFRHAAMSILVTLDGTGGDVRERLLSFAAVFSEKVMCPVGLALFRTMIAEYPRFPELATAFYAKGPLQTLDGLTDFLRRAMDEGKLRRDDPRFAAELLMSQLVGLERTRRLLGQPPTPEALERTRIERTVGCFLRAYAP
ncbi:MAG: TetR/AcrR family transcriptional regulator [Sterolibacteriaceae bacterium MAG5]|nr:TetR/AcrR family transcriptional regulator [Candidatus Nitricoxidireducens bremensis]